MAVSEEAEEDEEEGEEVEVEVAYGVEEETSVVTLVC